MKLAEGFIRVAVVVIGEDCHEWTKARRYSKAVGTRVRTFSSLASDPGPPVVASGEFSRCPWAQSDRVRAGTRLLLSQEAY